MTNPKISIIILHYKNINDTIECLHSLKNIDYENFETIVVNNDSEEHKKIIEKNFDNFARVIQNEKNFGFAQGNNMGIDHALKERQNDFILLLNNDTIVDKNILKELSKTETHMTAPKIMNYEDKNKIDNLGIIMMKSGLPFNRTKESQKIFCPSGGCALYSRRLLERLKCEYGYYFDPSYFAYCEDFDLGWRALLEGFSCGYEKDAIVFHKGSSVHGKISDFAVFHTYRNLFWTQIKNTRARELIFVLPFFVLGWISILSYHLSREKFKITLKIFIEALKGAPRAIRQRNTKNSTNEIFSIFEKMEKGLYPKNLRENR